MVLCGRRKRGVPPNAYYPGNFQLPLTQRVPVKRILLLINGSKFSASSPFTRGLIEVAEGFDVEVEVQVTTHSGHLVELARDLDLAGFDVICVAGGDGSVSEVANGLLQRTRPSDIPVGIIPVGTGNCVAYDLGLPPDAPEVAMQVACEGYVRRVDALEIEAVGDPSEPKVYSVQFVGWGASTRISQMAEGIRWVGGMMYDLATVKFILDFDWRYSVKVRLFDARPLHGEGSDGPPIPELVIEGDYALIQGQNSIHCSTRLPLAPEAALDDGLIDLMLLAVTDNTSRSGFAAVFDAAKTGSHTGEGDFEDVAFYKCRGFEVVPAEGVDARLLGTGAVNVDGELTSSAPFRVTTMKQRLCFMARQDQNHDSDASSDGG